MQVVIFSSPQREKMLNNLLAELKGIDLYVINSPETFGKEKFWMRWEQARLICLGSEHDNYLIIPDDISNTDIDRIREIHKENEGKLFTCNINNDGRKDCWGGDYFDCGGLTNRATLKKIKVEKVDKNWFRRRTSSGVGHQLTMQLRGLKAKLITPSNSLCYHGEHDSIMHPSERKKTPLITKGMKIVAGVATFKGREKSLRQTINSLISQVDQIVIYDNEINPDLADNGKFYGLELQKEPCYYLSCDDDLLYPPDYVQKMISEINRTKGIVTHHGRELLGLDRSYYKGHKAFRCLDVNIIEREIDVAGTGVTGFRTDYFNPKGIHLAKDKRMSDIVFSLEAKKQGKKITILKHKGGWIKQLEIDESKSCYATEINNQTRQIELANEIFNLK